MLKRLRIKFICINMAIVAVMLGVIFGFVLGTTRQNLERESLTMMHTALSETGHRPPRRFLDGMTEDADAAPELYLPYILIEQDWDGEIRNVQGYYDNSGDLSAMEDVLAAVEETGADSGFLKEYGLRFLRETAPMGSRCVLIDVNNETSTMKGLVRTCLLIGAAALAVFLFISLLLARWAVRPVEEAWTQQKQFVADASHELKTPLTVIMTNAELLQSPDYDPAAKGRFADNILVMARQMRGLVERLLELARVDNGAVESTAKELDFSRLCADALLPFEPLYYEKGLTLQSALAEGLRVRGSESHLREVVEILLDNAQKYADPGSEIRVTLSPAGGRCRLCVADEGENIPAEELKRLFERFYRADPSRSRDGSYGLGLAIAQKIVEEHRGKIWAESRDGINSFYVTLPLVP